MADEERGRPEPEESSEPGKPDGEMPDGKTPEEQTPEGQTPEGQTPEDAEPPPASEGGGPQAPRTTVPSPPDQPVDASGSASSRWWVAVAALAAALVLLVLAVFPPWPDEWVAGEFGAVPWWVAVPASLGAGALLFGLGRRWFAWGAAGAALGAAGLAASVAVRGPSTSDVGWEEYLAPDPVAPLAAALAAVAAAGFGALVAWRGVRLPPVRQVKPRRASESMVKFVPVADEPPRVRGRRMLVAVLAGALVGTLLSAGAGLGADRIHRDFLDPTPFEAVSETVPEEAREDGTDVTDEEYEVITDLGLTEVAWEDTLPGPAELTTCTVREPEADEEGRTPKPSPEDPLVRRSTLVTLEEGDSADAVVGYDPTDGGELWRYTVAETRVELPNRAMPWRDPVTHTSRIGQVGVTESCTVHVVVDPGWLVTLDGASGEVRDESVVPPLDWPSSDDQRGAREAHWTFVTESRPDDYIDHYGAPDPDRLVSLNVGETLYLESGWRLAELDGTTGEVRAVSDGFDSYYDCRYLATSANGPTVQIQGCGDTVYHDLGWRPPADSPEDLDGVDQLRLRGDKVPGLACEELDHSYEGPDITDLRSTSRSASTQRVLVGEWCDTYDGPLLVVADDVKTTQHTVVELPEGTELPLRPHLMRAGASVVWVDRGTVYHHYYGEGLEFGHEAAEPEYHEMYAGADPVEALVPPEHTMYPDDSGGIVQPYYAVTESGSVLKLTYQDDPHDSDGLASEVAEEVDGVAGTCEGTRDLVLDQPGRTLLALCETEDGTEVTAVSGERLAEDE